MTAPRVVPGETAAARVQTLAEPGVPRSGRRGRQREGEA